MHFAQFAILFGAGFVAGLMNSIAGGGTILTFPALIFAGVPPIPANATSTIALLPGVLAGLFGYRRNIPAAAGWIRRFALASLIGGLIGSMALVRTPPAVFDWLVPFLILFATVLFTAHSFFAKLLRVEPDHRKAAPGMRWLVGAIAFQFVVAIYGGYFGAGIGILMLASLGMLGIGHIHEMNTVKSTLGFLINIVAAIYFIWSGLIHWTAAGVMAVGAATGGYTGAHFAQKIPHRTVRHLITAIGFTLAVVMFVKKITHH
jgi:uncharacterized membrane protein YfcA